MRTKRMMAGMVAALVAGSLGGGLMAAESSEKYPAAEKKVDHMGNKMVRGVTNCATGWGEIPRQIVLSAEDDGPWLMLPVGLASGLTMTVVRTGYGALETAFFFIPFDGTYNSALNPAYVWQAEEPVSAAAEKAAE